jgi:hypothetical protein
LKLKGRQVDTIEEIQAESQSAWHSDRNGIPGSVPKVEETEGSVPTFGRELMSADRPYGGFYDFLQRQSEIFLIHLRTWTGNSRTWFTSISSTTNLQSRSWWPKSSSPLLIQTAVENYVAIILLKSLCTVNLHSLDKYLMVLYRIT